MSVTAFTNAVLVCPIGGEIRDRTLLVEDGVITGMGDAPEGADHGRHGEQAPVGGGDAQEVARQAADPGLRGDGVDGFRLLLGGEDRAVDQARQIGAAVEHRLEAPEVGLDLGDRLLLAGEFEQRTRIPFCDTRDW